MNFLLCPLGSRMPQLYSRDSCRGFSNPDEVPSFVSVYLDDVIVYSETLEDHLKHLQRESMGVDGMGGRRLGGGEVGGKQEAKAPWSWPAMVAV